MTTSGSMEVRTGHRKLTVRVTQVEGGLRTLVATCSCGQVFVDHDEFCHDAVVRADYHRRGILGEVLAFRATRVMLHHFTHDQGDRDHA